MALKQMFSSLQEVEACITKHERDYNLDFVTSHKDLDFTNTPDFKG